MRSKSRSDCQNFRTTLTPLDPAKILTQAIADVAISAALTIQLTRFLQKEQGVKATSRAISEQGKKGQDLAREFLRGIPLTEIVAEQKLVYSRTILNPKGDAARTYADFIIKSDFMKLVDVAAGASVAETTIVEVKTSAYGMPSLKNLSLGQGLTLTAVLSPGSRFWGPAIGDLTVGGVGYLFIGLEFHYYSSKVFAGYKDGG